MFKIKDGRPFFYQWDLNQKLIVSVEADQLHYCIGGQSPLTVEVKDGEADVPNIFLQSAGNLLVYAYVKEGEAEYTRCDMVFRVIPRCKPDIYVYEETQVMTFTAVLADAKAAREAAEEAQRISEEKAEEASYSKVYAEQSATDAAKSSESAKNSEVAALKSEQKAALSESAAGISETNAAGSAVLASNYATEAEEHKVSAENESKKAKTSAEDAALSKQGADDSANRAKASEEAASLSAKEAKKAAEEAGGGVPDGGVAGDMIVKQSATDGDVAWKRVTATDEEALAMLAELDLLPAATSGGAILTNGDGNILLWS